MESLEIGEKGIKKVNRQVNQLTLYKESFHCNCVVSLLTRPCLIQINKIVIKQEKLGHLERELDAGEPSN